MSNKYKSTYRCYLIDHHSPDSPIITLENLNFSQYEAFFREANIDSLMLYCKDHWGASYYDSQVPGTHKHPGLGQTDYIARVKEIADRMGIEFVAYYCLEYDEGAARSHPQWRALKPDGSGLIRDDLYAKWSIDCLRTGYGEYCLSQLEEICTRYRPDALFLDIFGTSLCYCPACRKAFADRFGYPLPETEEEVMAHSKDVTTFCDEHSEAFLQELRGRLKAIDPTLAITINFASHYPLNIRRLLDYQFAEPVLQDNWFSAAYTRDTAKGRYPLMMPGEFSAVYNYQSTARYITDLSEIAAQGCRVGMYSGSQHPDGTLDFEEARRLGAAFREIEAMHPMLTGREPMRYVGILQSDLCNQVGIEGFPQDAILRLKRSEPHRRAILGAMKLCEHAKIPWNVIPVSELDDPSRYPVLILPEFYIVTPELAEKLKAYVEQGGILMASALTGTYAPDLTSTGRFALEELLGVRFRCVNRSYEANTWSAYLAPRHPMGGIFATGTTPPVSEFFVETELCGAEPIADLILPCVACDEAHWVNWWSPPPECRDSGLSAVTVHRQGKGAAIYTAFDLFTMAAGDNYACVHDLFAHLLTYAPRPQLQNVLDAPESVRTSLCTRSDGAWVVHQISQMPKLVQGEVLPVSGGILRGTGPAPSRARLAYPEARDLEICKRDEGWEIALPSLTLQQITELYF